MESFLFIYFSKAESRLLPQHWSVWIHWDYMQMASLITNQSHSLTVHLTAGWATAIVNSCSRTENAPLNLSDESRKPREESKRFVFANSEDSETSLGVFRLRIKYYQKELWNLYIEEKYQGEHMLHIAKCLNRWHVITLSHSKRACPITRVKSSVQELRLPHHFAWSASRWDSRTEMQQGGSAVPWRGDFIGSQSQRYHLFKNVICSAI